MGGGRGVGAGPCGVCQAVSSLTCGGCGDMHYCGKEHQRRHWAQHRALCRPYREVTDPRLGRYLVASRRLKAGQEVMEDQPLVYGPMAVTLPVCLGCHSPVPEAEEMLRCPGCWWPLCSPECATSSLHKRECHVLAKDINRISPPKEYGETSRYDVIMVLRVLLLRSSNPDGWAVVLDMEHHTQERAQSSKLELDLTVHFIREVLDLDYTEEEVAQVRGAIATNAMQIRSPGGVLLRVLHPRVRLFNHSCIPNLQLSYTDDAVMVVRTALPMEAGDTLYVTYTGTTMPLWERRSCLRENYFFTCECTRCSDPTEIDTNFSNPRCPVCYWCLMQPYTWLGTTTWVCPKCKTEKSEEVVRDEALSSLSSLDMMDVVEGSSFRRLQYSLEQLEHDYHPQHFVWMKVAQKMLHKLQEDESDRGLKLRVAIWQKLSVLYDKLEPGLTRRRGMSILEMGLSVMRSVRLEYKMNKVYIPALIEQLRSVIGYFQEAEDIMSYEPPKARMRILADRARKRKEEAEELLKKLQSEESLSK